MNIFPKGTDPLGKYIWHRDSLMTHFWELNMSRVSIVTQLPTGEIVVPITPKTLIGGMYNSAHYPLHSATMDPEFVARCNDFRNKHRTGIKYPDYDQKVSQLWFEISYADEDFRTEFDRIYNAYAKIIYILITQPDWRTAIEIAERENIALPKIYNFERADNILRVSDYTKLRGKMITYDTTINDLVALSVPQRMIS